MWVEVAMSDYFIHVLFKRLTLPKVLSLHVILLLFGTLDFAIFDIFGMKKKIKCPQSFWFHLHL